MENLIERIKSTNNGYLFVPTQKELEIARQNPDIFIIQGQKEICGCHFRILLK